MLTIDNTEETVPTHALRLRAAGREFDDALVTEFYGTFEGLIASAFGVLVVTVYLESDDRITEARHTIDQIEDLLGVVVESVDPDLVNVADIARRVGKTRQAVQHWVRGDRGPGAFPRPVGAPGGSKVWPWADVDDWLARSGIEGADEERPLSRTEATIVDGWLARRRCRDDLADGEELVFSAAVDTFDLTFLSRDVMGAAARAHGAMLTEQEVRHLYQVSVHE